MGESGCRKGETNTSQRLYGYIINLWGYSVLAHQTRFSLPLLLPHRIEYARKMPKDPRTVKNSVKDARRGLEASSKLGIAMVDGV